MDLRSGTCHDININETVLWKIEETMEVCFQKKGVRVVADSLLIVVHRLTIDKLSAFVSQMQ